MRWTLIERFHWTPKEFDELCMADLHEFLQVEDGRQKGEHLKEQIRQAKTGHKTIRKV